MDDKKQETVKVVIDCDEWYPCFSFSESGNRIDRDIIEIPIEKYEWLKKVDKDWDEAQEYMRNI